MIDDINRAPNLDEKKRVSLEASLIAEFFAERGFTMQDLKQLPPEEARQLRIEASKYATARLAELEARARFISTIHQATQGVAD
jgi:N-acetylglutamate synthase-like GNAT family acetyltransferase